MNILGVLAQTIASVPSSVGFVMDVGVDTKYEDDAEWELTPEPYPPSEQDSQCQEMSSHVSLVPANMAARPPVQWSVREVKVWLEFCVTEFSLPSICVNKFDMNGKALTLLTRTDFIERAPHAGDILYNVFQRCLHQERPGYLRPPAFLPTHVTLPASEIRPRQAQIHSARSSYIPIRPQPSSGNNGSKPIYPTSSSLMLAASDNVPAGPGVPASMLSPAPSERCPSDSDSSHNENGQSPPHSSDHEMEYEEGVNFDPGRDVKCDMSDQNCDGVCRLLWEFIYQLLQDTKWSELVSWESEGDLTFRILNPTNLADAWGKQKNRSNMTYEKLSRALRYYYKMNIIKKVPGKRLTYKFLQHPAAIRKGQRGARPHSSRQAKARSADTDHEASVAPDSSTFLPPQALAISPTTSRTATLTSFDAIRDANSPRHHINPEELPENIMKPVFRRDIEDQHFQCSSQRIRASQDRGSFLYQEAADFPASEATMNARTLRNVSPGTHLEAKQNQQSNIYKAQQQAAPEDNDFLRRSQLAAFNTSPETINSSKSLVVMDKGVESIPSLQIDRGHIYRDKSHLSLRIPEQNSNLFTYYDGAKHSNSIQGHNSIQGPNQEKDIFSRSSSPLSSATPLSFISRSSLRFNEENCSVDNGYPTLYVSAPRGHHPYPQLVSLSCTPPPLPSYGYSQQRLNHISTEPYQRSLKNHLKPRSFPQDSDRKSSNTPYPYCVRQSLKQEASDQEQEEPQDLSLKTSLKKPDPSKENSQSDLPRESGLEDAHRDSPRSNSSDSAYSSDRADFVKEETPGSVE